MAVSTYQCRNAEGRPKAGYVSEHAAKAACARSPRWRLRKSWPTAYLCSCCHRWHLGHPKVEQ